MAEQAYTPRLKQHYNDVRQGELDQAVRLHEPDAGAAPRQDRAEHGHRRSRRPIRKMVQAAARRSRDDRRPEARHHQGAQGDRDLQDPRGHGRSAPRSRCARPACTSSSTGWSPSRCRGCATSAACTRRASTAAAITRSGIKEHIIFPEIDYDKVEACWGMDIIICTTAQHRRRSAGAAQGVQLSVPQLADAR